MHKNSEMMYRLLFEQSRDAITIVDNSGHFIDANPAFVKLMGYSLDDLLHMNARNLWVHPEDRVEWGRILQEQGAVIEYESQQKTKDGIILDLLITSTARSDQHGNSIFQTFLRDVTERKKNERERERLYNELKSANLEIGALRAKELEYLNAIRAELLKGQKIQQCFLPHSLPAPLGWELKSVFKPAKEISGDFFDSFMINERTMVLVIGDGCGKDVSAALFMSSIQTLIRILSERDFSSGRGIGDTIGTVNDFLCRYYQQRFGNVMYATMIYGMLDLVSGVFRYVGAGHPVAYILHDDLQHRRLPSINPAVGMQSGLVFRETEVELDQGDVLFTYTDGITDGKNALGEFFTSARLALLLAEPHGSALEVVTRVEKALDAHVKNAPQFDDITMLAIARGQMESVPVA